MLDRLSISPRFYSVFDPSSRVIYGSFIGLLNMISSLLNTLVDLWDFTDFCSYFDYYFSGSTYIYQGVYRQSQYLAILVNEFPMMKYMIIIKAHL